MENCDKCGSKVEEKIVKLDVFTYALLLGALGTKIRYVSLTEKDGTVRRGFHVQGHPFIMYFCE